jgi:pyruvate dehydrogenase E2 component (dihydrolipoamide acetyltransferase)
MGVDINAVPSSDPSGRITAQDIMNFAKGSTGASPAEAKPAESVKTATPGMESGQDKWGTLELEPMNAIRRKTAEHLTECWRIPHVTHFDQADITDLEAVRKKNAKKVESAGGRLNTISFILKVAVEALQRFPKFNASLDLENQRVIFKKYYHIGVAVDTPNGLLVPVLRDVDRKSLVELSVELPQLAEKARTRKLSLEDMQGGTFTISNLGGLGGVGFTPIINAPQVAILGVSRASVAPVYIDGVFQPRTLLPLSLSYDHRLIDGADAARFLRWVAEALEDPWRMFLGE